MNFKKKLQIFCSLFLLFLFPVQIFAYSDKVILGGENIGIEVEEKYINIVGFYKVNGKYIAKEAGLKIGDKILKVNQQDVSSTEEMIKIIDNTSSKTNIVLTVLRNNQTNDYVLNLKKDDKNVYKTGIYVKDQITGIGTLTYIDPKTKIYGALGHEIVDSRTNQKIEIKNGKIFQSSITGIEKSESRNTGEKNAIFYSKHVYGTVTENTISGIFGNYQKSFSENNLIDVGEKNEIKLGNASIYTVINGEEKEEFSINILNVNLFNETKNILFEITDKELLEKTGGVIKGMSGSPIVQDGKLIGAVTHAIVDENGNKGYGIFITTMLNEGEN